MIRKIITLIWWIILTGGNKMINLVGDFETTTDINDCRVWASCLVDVSNNRVVHLSNSIDDTLKFLKELSKYTSVNVYYHNLKFDGEFWIQHLMNNGFTYNEKLNDKNTFNTLITDTGAFYKMTVKFNKGKNANKIHFLDSLKILPLSVEVLAKSFELPILKGSINYNTYRGVNHILTEEEKTDVLYYLAIRSYLLKLRAKSGSVSITEMNAYVKELLADAIKGDEVKVLTKQKDDTINVIELLSKEKIEIGY